MTANHTPGPWEYRNATRIYADGVEIAQVSTLLRTCKQLEIMEANSRLIAAAPDLLQALEHVLENYKYNNDKGLGIGPIMRAEAAIKKARGQE